MISCLALFFAIAGGSAIALQGRNSVDSGDIKRGAVKTADIANNAVTTRKIKDTHVRAADIQTNAVGTSEIGDGQVGTSEIGDGQVGTSEIGDGQVGDDDLAAPEPYTLAVLGNGGEGDCIWSNRTFPPVRTNPPAFYKDAFDRVHLAGFIEATNGGGGDGMCGGSFGEGTEDSTAFVLPEGYRPKNDEIRQSGPSSFVIVGDTPLVTAGGTAPAGAVFELFSGSPLLLDGVSFRAAGPSNGLPRRRSVGGGDLEDARSGLSD